MRAIDTNIVVRFIAQDDPDQTRRATGVIAGGSILVPTSVMIESEWVLRSTYRFQKERLIATLKAFASLPGVAMQDSALMAKAFDLAGAGMDFADAIHLLSSKNAEAFVTFDRKLQTIARRQTGVKIVEP